MRKIAFFDFDGTITTKDTFIEFAAFAKRRDFFIKALAKSLPSIIKWKLGFITNSDAKQNLFSNLFKGESREDFNECCENFIPKIEKILRPEIIRKIKDFQKENAQVVIVSASIKNWIQPWANEIGIKEILATELETDSADRLTGRFATPNCHGSEKVVRIKEYIPDLDECETWAYGDSSGDTEMLAFADHPYKVKN